MSLTYNEDQKALAAALKSFVLKKSPMSRVREVVSGDAPYAAAVWDQLSRELGLAALTIPENFGGVGGSQSDVAVALRELGKGLVPSPMLGSAILATGALVAVDDQAEKERSLSRLASGEISGALAVSEDGHDSWIPDRPNCRAEPVAGGMELTGVKTSVLNGGDADVLVVQAIGPHGVGLFLVPPGATGIIRTPVSTVDLTLGLARVEFDHSPAIPLDGDACAVLDRVSDLANLAICALSSGGMAAIVAMSANYAKTRFSFGQPIGAYQGVKHKIAEMYTSHQLAEAALRQATSAFDRGADDAAVSITAARLLFNNEYFPSAVQNQLVHGGIGYTWEHDAHLYSKNAMSLRALCGDQDHQRDRLASQLGL